MSRFTPLQFLGSEKEISLICDATIDTLNKEFNLIISQKPVIPVIVDCFIDAAVYESLQLTRSEVKSELNLFEIFRLIHELVPGEDNGVELLTTLTLGRMGMRKLEMELSEDIEEVSNKIADIDIKLLEQISMRASSYIEDRHGLYLRDYPIIFKVAEVFFNELVTFIKVNTLNEDTLTVFDQFTILLDENGRFESIEISEYMQQTISTIYLSVMNELDRLDDEDTAFAENKINGRSI